MSTNIRSRNIPRPTLCTVAGFQRKNSCNDAKIMFLLNSTTNYSTYIKSFTKSSVTSILKKGWNKVLIPKVAQGISYYRDQPKAGTGHKMPSVPFVFWTSRYQGPAFRCLIALLLELVWEYNERAEQFKVREKIIKSTHVCSCCVYTLWF